jgi:hypothetical protein
MAKMALFASGAFRLFAIHKKGAIRKTVPRLPVANSV